MTRMAALLMSIAVGLPIAVRTRGAEAVVTTAVYSTTDAGALAVTPVYWGAYGYAPYAYNFGAYFAPYAGYFPPYYAPFPAYYPAPYAAYVAPYAGSYYPSYAPSVANPYSSNYSPEYPNYSCCGY